jgi:uncharacterized membrane protein YqjE
VQAEKSIATVLAETKEELKEFFSTRLEMLRAELKEKTSTWKQAIVMLVIAAVLLLAAWMTLTFALIAFFHAVFITSVYSWLFAGLIVGGIYLAIGGLVGWFGYSELKSAGVKPTRTLEVLKQDQVWIQNEARSL